MASAAQRKIRKDLAELREIVSSRRKYQRFVIIFQHKDSDPDEIKQRIDAAVGQHVLRVEFVGPEGGPELGRGCLTSHDLDDDVQDDDYER